MKPDEIFRSLAEHEVEFVLVGGLAATAHGVSLVTMDTDVCFRQTPENCEKLAKALARLQAEIYPPRQVTIPITADLLHTHKIIHLRTLAGRLDLLGAVPGLGSYDEMIDDAVTLDLGGLRVPVLTLDQLIQAKSVLNQPKDREHLDQLLAIRKLRQKE